MAADGDSSDTWSHRYKIVPDKLSRQIWDLGTTNPKQNLKMTVLLKFSVGKVTMEMAVAFWS